MGKLENVGIGLQGIRPEDVRGLGEIPDRLGGFVDQSAT